MSNNKSVDIKWGIYPIEDRELPIEQMCDRAMLAARSVKGKYDNYFAYYNSNLRDKLLRQQAIIDSMERALEEEQFQIYFQPKYRISDEWLAGAEALIRWKHPEWGMLSPAEFIPLFERNGFITQLDQFVWKKVCEVLAKWKKEEDLDFQVSVNVSRADIYGIDIVDVLTSIIQDYNLAPEQLHLEITESAYTENSQQLIEVVNHLRELGFIIEMDDFGSGYSSLNILNQMPIDVLKLDMKFIQSETEKPINQGILRFIMELARWMRLSVVAEGIETREQLERLTEVGCDYVQGYYFARPMPIDEFEKFMKNEQLQRKADRTCNIYEEYSEKQILLIADEDKKYIEEIRKKFSSLFCIIEAADTTTVIKLVCSYKNRIAIILLSYNLCEPGVASALELIRDNRNFWKIPVIVTGPADEEIEECSLMYGASDYAYKPHTKESLAKRISHVLKLNASQLREKMLREDAFRDHMTGTLNRRGWLAAVNALQIRDKPMAICFFDMDNLKEINDICGHSEGDRLIVKFSEIVRLHIRETDILARLGGDEFIVILKNVKSPESALKKCQEICRVFRKEPTIKGMQTTASAGIVMWNMDCSVEEITRQVDIALYRAKATHDGQCVLL